MNSFLNFWSKFKNNRRGYYSLLFFSFLFFTSLFAEIIANDKPLMVYHQGNLYFPIIQSYPEATFCGKFETTTNYRDPYVVNLIEKNGWMVMPPIPYGYSTINYNITNPAPTAPDRHNLLGTDDNGRDVLARLLYGLRISLIFGLILTLFSTVIGVSLGAIQGYFGGIMDLILQRFMEIWSSLPVLFLLIILSSIIEPGFFILLFLMLIFSWMSLVGLVRAEFLRIRNFDFVRSARAIGASHNRIIFVHILPNAIASTLAILPFFLSHSIITLTALDFLGFGLSIETPSLGELLAQGKNNIFAYHLGMSGFVIITTISCLLIFIGEAVRDTLDVTLSKS
ncbi:MAG: microcin C transport system permease protein [Rickettsiales bacterium]|jgi:microcin C transport system permease protein